ncbi:MAG: biopolymer transporter ExbD [Gammaproteobacteria bacterium]|nr:MAG: biopolymer transporter ExbD [Gammaproteobacteria bacterium]
MKSRRLRARRSKDPAELNITAFMNLMVVLVPFLLITAVFSRLAVLELNLPAPGEGGEDDDQPALALEVTVRDDRLELGDRNRGSLAVITREDDDRAALLELSERLQDLKAQHPDTLAATLLLEPDIQYDLLVQVMDTVRVVEHAGNGELEQLELFPDISIGDAPILASAEGTGR